MASGLTLDVTRLVTRFSRRTPNGIDRVDFAYAQRFLGEDGSNATGIIWTPLGAARVGAARLRPALDALRRHWRETAPRARATRSIARANVHLNVSQFPPARSADPFFVVLGTIEPRKNHLLLLDVWRAMIRKNPAGTPKLAIVGKRGWENETTFALIDRSPELRPYLFQERAMDTPALCALIDGALGALMPSFAEGYGLPVHEALARGAPVIASDIPAFRAISSPLLKLIDPTDGLAWQTAIESLSAAARECGETRRGPTWDEHFATVEAFLAAL